MHLNRKIKLKPAIILLYSFLTLFCTPLLANASKAYITDQFRISLRRGPTIENKILRFIPSGSPVEIIQKTTEGWTEVKTLSPDEKQITGWVLSRYLVHRLPYYNQTILLKEENQNLREMIENNNNSLSNNSALISELKNKLKETTANLANSQQKYNELKKNSQNYFKLKNEFDLLEKKYLEAQEKREEIESKRYHQWMLAGAGILILGYLAGFGGGKREKKNKRRGYI